MNYPEQTQQDFARLINIRAILENEGINVITLSNKTWGDYRKKTAILKNPFLLIKSIPEYLKYLNQIKKTLNNNNYDKIIVGYPAYIEAFYLKSFFRRKKILNKVFIDFFISIYDTLVLDRKYFKRNFIFKFVIYQVEKCMLRKYNNVIIDTYANANRYSKLFNIDINKFSRIIVSSSLLNTKIDFPTNDLKDDSKTNIGWVGSIIPLHGVEKIIQTAKLLDEKKYLFHLIGNGPKNEIDNLIIFAKKLGVRNVTFYGKLPYEESMKLLSKCDLLLGIFGDSEKAKSVISFKIFDYICLGKPVITQKSNALNELGLFEDILQVESNPSSITNAIVNFKFNIKPTIGNNRIKIEKLLVSDLNKIIMNNE
ncbi:MAG: glycosyltransferase family 4 protein [Bacteroidetes bacterium]|nr:glycosyltransferase family 4 protein [Bacteroidota bacterium]